LDEILGRNGRKDFADVLAQRTYGGKKHEWKTFADWGRQLLAKGQVTSPPEGTAPSPLLSQAYRCIHCHNLVREDAKLTVQDPEARERLLRDKPPADGAKREATGLALTPGTTLWGAVNRERFYNGYYAKYHDLRVGSGQQMDPQKLADAVQICCRFCSVGRYPEAWELDSILAALWDLELHVRDLDLAADKLPQLLADLDSESVLTAAKARQAIKGAHLQAASATRLDVPVRSTAEYDEFPGGEIIKGNAETGKLLYQSACAACHHSEFNLPEGRALATNAARYHRYLWQGTERDDDLYMPFFTKERLSRRQAADIRAYLRSLPNP
jgi:mono/diheme cytochrome c family protein